MTAALEHTDTCGWRTVTASTVAGVSYRQADYWARTGVAVPSLRAADGSGTQRLYSAADIIRLRIASQLVTAGLSVQQTRRIIPHITDHLLLHTPGRWVLISDGTGTAVCADHDALRLIVRPHVFVVVSLNRIADDVLTELQNHPSETVETTGGGRPCMTVTCSSPGSPQSGSPR